jgi:hypothetical protein
MMDNVKNGVEHRLGVGSEPQADEGFVGHIGPHQTGPPTYLPGEYVDRQGNVTDEIVWWSS